MAELKPPLSPGDLRARKKAGQLRVGGRVAHVEAGRVLLADAFHALWVELDQPAQPGELLIVSGRYSRGRLRAARIEFRKAAPLPAASGEFARLSWTKRGALLDSRARALATVREFFRRRGFLEVETSLAVPAPGVDLHLDAVECERGYLITSPELQMKRLLVGGVPRVFQIARCTRAGEQGPLHEPEFSLLEWYRAFSGEAQLQRDTEQLVERVVRTLHGSTRIELPDGRRVEFGGPYPRLSVREAFLRFAGVRDAVELAERDEDGFFRLLVERVEPALADAKQPVFLCRYPISQASLARAAPDDPTVAERFELYAAGVELCNGFGELTDPVEQARRFRDEQRQRRASKRRVYPIDERFLAALREGMPPAGGNALGFDRLLMLAAGRDRIADVMAFAAQDL